MTVSPDDLRKLTERLAEVRAKLRAIEEQVDLTEWKTLFNEMVSLERKLRESESAK
jgi:hypothetical protein